MGAFANIKLVASAVSIGFLSVVSVGHAQNWPAGASSINADEFAARDGQVWSCSLHSGHSSFNELGREYYFEGTREGRGTLHSVTQDRGTLISQGYQVRGFNNSAVYLRRGYVYDDGVRYRQFEGDSVSIPMKVAGGDFYPGTFKDIDGEFQVGILRCAYDRDGTPDWAY